MRVLLLPLGLLVVATAVAVATLDRWLFWALDPGPFDPALTPSAPDYDDPRSWAALPETDDGADVALPDHPAIDPAGAAAAVFYVHPTTSIGRRWNAPIDEPAVVDATTRGGTLIQASVFNACCAVYAPRYRQASGLVFVRPDEDSARAVDVAYGDVAAAFAVFLARIGERPFIIAGHSQGAVLAARLVRERINGPLRRRLVAAYLPGAPLRRDELAGVPVCDSPGATGCVVGWNSRGPEYRGSRLEFDADRGESRREWLCVNPITWTNDGARAPASAHAGAVFFDTPAPAVKPAFADAQCVEGTLVITEIGDLERDLASRVLLWATGPGNYHPIEYQLFYLDLRRNAVERVRAFTGGGPYSPQAP